MEHLFNFYKKSLENIWKSFRNCFPWFSFVTTGSWEIIKSFKRMRQGRSLRSSLFHPMTGTAGNVRAGTFLQRRMLGLERRSSRKVTGCVAHSPVLLCVFSTVRLKMALVDVACWANSLVVGFLVWYANRCACKFIFKLLLRLRGQVLQIVLVFHGKSLQYVTRNKRVLFLTV